VARTARTKAGSKAGAAKPEAESVVPDFAQGGPSIIAGASERLDPTPDTASAPLIAAEPDPVSAEAPDLTEPVAAPETVDAVSAPHAETEMVTKTVVEPESAAEQSLAPPEPPVPPVPPVPPRPEPVMTSQKQNAVLPMVLGGVVAAALGFGAAWYWMGAGPGVDPAIVAAQAERIAALEAGLGGMPDIAPLEAQVAALGPDMMQEIAALDASVAAALLGFDERLAALERAPSEDGTLAQTAIDAWEQELDMLRADVAAERERMQQIANEADAQLAQTRVEATALVDDASQTASAAVARASLSRVSAAIDAGTPFDSAVAELSAEGVAVPDALTGSASEGVASLATLTASFPESARAALATARREGLAGEEGGGFTAFLRSQFDVRSVMPRDGTDPDAILSRAEAALQANRLSDALAEVASLPEVARAEMSGWIAAADARLAALAAVLDLSQSLNQN